MGSQWTYTVTHYDKSNSWADVDITYAVEAIPVFTDTSGEQINTCTVEISANLGHFIRPARVGETGFPTQIDHNDRIRIEFDDGTSTPYNQIFEVVKKIPVKSKAGGTTMRIDCEGIERHLQKMKYIKPFYFATPNEAILDLIAYYSANKTSGMPAITIGVNQLPSSGIHSFDWGINEDSIYNRLKELVDLMGSAAGLGGVLDFFDFRFTYPTTNVENMVIDIFSSGSPSNGSIVTVNADTINTGDESAGIDESEATLLGIWGDNAAGTLPIDYSRFSSRQILFGANGNSYFPVWDSSVAYPIGSIVQYTASGTNLVYRRQVSQVTPTGTAPNLDANWVTMTMAQYYGTNSTSNYDPVTGVGTSKAIQYSPWTSGQATLWKNANCDPTGANNPYGSSTGAMFDGNIVTNDDVGFRTWVDFKTDNGLLDTDYTYNNSTQGAYEGLRVLVNTATPAAPFNNPDAFGKDFKWSIAEYTGGAWRVKYDAFGDSNLFAMRVIVLDMARQYVWDDNPTGGADTGIWNDVTALDNGSDCMHSYTSLTNTQGVILDSSTQAQFGTPNLNSAITARFEFTPALDGVQELTQKRIGIDYFRVGGWLGFRWPFPKNTKNGISEDVGEIYGGGIQGLTVKAPTHIDAQNMHYTHNGYRGFNTASTDALESEDYGQLSSIDFAMKLRYYNDDAAILVPWSANFKMRAFFFDSSDNVVFQDFVMKFNDHWESVSLPISGFQTYRGRVPRRNAFGGDDIFPPNGLNANDVFEWRNLTAFCIQTQESYDNFGRYQAGQGKFKLDLFNSVGLNMSIELSIDALRFRKPLLNITDVTTDDVKTPDFLQHQEVIIYDQLENISKSELEKRKFQATEYELETEIKTDIKYGDFLFFVDDEIVNQRDYNEDSPPVRVDNNVKLVNRGTEYSITKPVDGKGGALRRMRTSRRFEA